MSVFRDLWRQRFSICLASAVIGFGIAIVAAGAGTLHSLLLKPIAVDEADRVVNLYHSPLTGGLFADLQFSFADYSLLRERQSSLFHLFAWTRFRATVAAAPSRVVMGEAVTGEYFEALRVSPLLGRVLSPADDAVGAPPALVLSESLWSSAFQRDPSVLSLGVRLNGTLINVVGIVPNSFQGIDVPSIAPTLAWISLSSASAIPDAVPRFTFRMEERDRRWLLVRGRMRPGVTLDQVQAEVAGLGVAFDGSHPFGVTLEGRARRPPRVSRQWTAVPTTRVTVHESVYAVADRVAGVALVMIGAVFAVVLLNAVTVLLTRDLARWRDWAIRTALGATPMRLISDRLLFGLSVVCLAGSFGLVLWRAAAGYFVAASVEVAPGLSATLTLGELTGWLTMILVGTAGTALIVVSLVPTLRMLKVVPAVSLQLGSPAVTSRLRWHFNLVAVQSCVSFLLISGAAVSYNRALGATSAVSDHFQIDEVGYIRLESSPGSGLPTSGQRERVALLERLRVLAPGLVFDYASGLPIGEAPTAARVSAGGSGSAEFLGTPVVAATAGAVGLLGHTLRSGRMFGHNEQEREAVINELLSQRLFGDENALGKRLFVADGAANWQEMLIVGIVRSSSGGQPWVFVPFSQHHTSRTYLLIRSPGADVRLLRQIVRKQLDSLGQDVVAVDSGVARDLLAPEMLPLRAATVTMGGLGVFALVLTLFGLYVAVSYSVSLMRRELGLRTALGATPREIRRLILFRGVRPVFEGLLIATVFLIAVLVFRPAGVEVRRPDVVTIAVVAAGFVGLAVAAAYAPARRAASSDVRELLAAS